MNRSVTRWRASTVSLVRQSRIQYADKAIVQFGLSKIADGDVILTFARSSVIELLLQSAQEQGVSFRAIIVDSRPMLEGRQLLERLAAAGVRCTYVMLNAVSYIMRARNARATRARARPLTRDQRLLASIRR